MLLLSACLSSPVVLAQGASPLISVQGLKQRLGQPGLLLLDASMPPAKKRIPGAVTADVFGFGGREISAEDSERMFQRWGVSPDSTVVIYDAGGSFTATSAYFELVYHGFPLSRIFVLDGGLAKWTADGGAVTEEPAVKPPAGSFRVKPRDESMRVRKNGFIAATGDPAKHAVVDALEMPYYYGAAKFFDRAGHVPGAVSLPTSDLFNADKTFKPASELKRLFEHLGLRPDRELISHCGGGVAASANWFAARFLLGYPDAKLYKESQLEWLRDDRGLPFWTYAEPTLMRDHVWLSGWNADMIRMFGAARLSVIDARPAESYAAGHIRFAVNLPADELWRLVNQPQELAAKLGATGVNAGNEAVIVADGGISPRAALAFLALHAAGHPRVSILTESVDEWGFAGHAISKTPTVVGAPGDPRQASVPPAVYPVRSRKDLFVNPGDAAKGAYPRIHVATGSKAPSTPADGKWLHLPASDLLAAKSAPKAAKDLLGLLAKAGVSRYAEIVLSSDDPGDMAIAFVILKLMGYPDVKLMKRAA